MFSIVIENSGLAAAHNDSAPRAYKCLIGFWHAVLVGFWPPSGAVLFCPLGQSMASGPAVIVPNPQDLRIPAIVYSISGINKLYYFISLSVSLTWTTNYLKKGPLEIFTFLNHQNFSKRKKIKYFTIKSPNLKLTSLTFLLPRATKNFGLCW
jgi:hypothetical protein